MVSSTLGSRHLDGLEAPLQSRVFLDVLAYIPSSVVAPMQCEARRAPAPA